MMQRNGNMVGMPIGMGSGERFEDRMRRIAMTSRSAARCPVTGDSPWIVLRVASGREIAVKNFLYENGVEVLVPMRQGPELRRRGRVIPPSWMPVMLCYVLVRCLVSDRAMLGLKSVEHVQDVLGGCATPRLISAKEANVFKAKAEEGQYDWERPVGIVVRRGDKVLITGGPFVGLRGIVETPNTKQHGDVVVSVDMLGRTVPTNLPLADLQKL